MFAAQRLQCLEKITWVEASSIPNNDEAITIFEGLNIPGMAEAAKDVNFRILTYADGTRAEDAQDEKDGLAVKEWLGSMKTYPQNLPAVGGPTAEGGIRIILCNRPGHDFGMSLTKPTFQAVEKAFRLHPTTLPAFMVNGGLLSMFHDANHSKDDPGYIYIVYKACQKVELGNVLISLSHDIAAGWTNVFVCGDGILYGRPHCDVLFGSQMQQMIDIVTNTPTLWKNPVFIPAVFLQIYSQRIHTYLRRTDDELIELENELGVTSAGRARPIKERKQWPQDVDPQKSTKSLHSLLASIIYMSSCCKWLHRSTETLLQMEQQLQYKDSLTQHHKGFHEIRESTMYIASISKTFEQYFAAFKERATTQVNVLFSIISQQEAILNRFDSQQSLSIARASKQDGIATTTFTLITAIFLPSTFVATVFSMTMFDWQAGDNIGNQTPASPGSSTADGGSYVSPKFWIFFAIAVPLTLFTLAFWRLWFRYASRKWEEKFHPMSVGGAYVTQFGHSGTSDA